MANEISTCSSVDETNDGDGVQQPSKRNLRLEVLDLRLEAMDLKKRLKAADEVASR